jgi:ketosteroid isomerase-like protein
MGMSQANIAIVQSLYAAFGRGDIGAILEGCTPDVEWQSGGQKGDFPVFGPRKGIAEVQEFFRTVSESHEFQEFSPREFYADRDKVFVLGHYALTMKRNGRQAASDWVHVFTFRGGRVEKFREFTDTAAFIDAFRA